MFIGYRHNNVVVAFAVATLIISCSNNESGNGHENHKHKNAIQYTCPMHPQIVKDKPGECPICGMKLVKKEQTSESGSESLDGVVKVSERSQELAAMTVDTARLGLIAESVVATGIVVPDESTIHDISSRVKGRIEKLFVRSVGEQVVKGQPLIQIYSEQLLADKQGLLSAIEKANSSLTNSDTFKAITNGMRNRLALWGLTDEQIDEIARSKDESPNTTILSGSDGVVIELMVHEGDYVDAGMTMFRVADLTSVWIETQWYTEEISQLNTSSEISVTFDRFTDDGVKGNIVFVNPQQEPNSRIGLMRVSVHNQTGSIKPGMLAYVRFNKQEKQALLIRRTAIIDERMPTVWVKKGPELFEQRMVKTGVEGPLKVEILSGLSVGDLVVNGGAYLVSSQYQLEQGTSMKHGH